MKPDDTPSEPHGIELPEEWEDVTEEEEESGMLYGIVGVAPNPMQPKIPDDSDQGDPR
jgi:hypothetical protein